ncbi:MAG: hypothetical protein KDB27_20530, partial [Planctomycetales bacterium]|nr:hypothetical protein [Planctomycetales bacterium]
MKLRFAFAALVILTSSISSFAGPKGEVFVPFTGSPKQIDGDFSDWPLANYTTIAQQPEFPEGQGVGEPTDAKGDHIVFDIDRIGPFNGTDPIAYEPEGPSDYGSAVYFAYDQNFLYVLGVFIDDEAFGFRGPDGLSNFLNDGFEIFIDANNDTDDLIAEIAFPAIDEEEPNLDDFQFTMGLNNEFPAPNPGPNDIGVEVHMERAGDFEVIKEGYLEIRDSTDFSAVGGRDVAARTYDDLRAAGATNPEIVANPGATYEGYAVEVAIPFGIVDGFEPTHSMGFDLFWRDVDIPEDFDEFDPQGDAKPGFGGSGILWADWNHAETVSGADEDGNLFHGGNWGSLVFGSQLAGDLNSDGAVDVADIDLQATWLVGGAPDVAAADLNGDGAFDVGDRVYLVETILNTFLGDANLDGEFNSSDFVAVFSAAEYEDAFESNSTWAEGDW